MGGAYMRLLPVTLLLLLLLPGFALAETDTGFFGKIRGFFGGEPAATPPMPALPGDVQAFSYDYSDGCSCEENREALETLRLGLCNTLEAAGIEPDPLLGCVPLSAEEAVVGSCCHPKISYVNEMGVFPVTCLDSLTQHKCELLQGSWEAEGACETMECELLGACCDQGVCMERAVQSDCAGAFHENLSCAMIQCTAPTGACCEPEISYVNESGVFPVPCLDSLTQHKCELLSGNWFEGESCDAAGCIDGETPAEPPAEDPTGSCCHPEISYVDEVGVHPVTCLDSLTQHKCGLLQGAWEEGGDCETMECELLGACCDEGACANGVTEDSCDGDFHQEVGCSAVNCEASPDPTGSCCHPEISYVDEVGVHPVSCLDELTAHKCGLLQGEWEEGECAKIDCSPLGACCEQNGDCEDAQTSTQCTGEWHEGGSCTDVECVQLQPGVPDEQIVRPVESSICCATEEAACLDDVSERECAGARGEYYEGQSCETTREDACQEQLEVKPISLPPLSLR